MKTFISCSRGVLIPAIFLTSIGWLVPANSAQAQSKFYLGAAPNNSLENTLPLAKQIKDAGGALMLDIHYSNTWADPQHQETPVAWRDLDVAGLEKRVEEYSKDVITQLKNAGAMPDMVQVGNEITGGML